SPRRLQSACHSAGIVGRPALGVPVIGREGLLRMVEWAERLRACDFEAGEASQGVRTRESSSDGGGEGNPRDGAVDVVSGGEPERGPGAAEHAPGTAGGGGRSGGGSRR